MARAIFAISARPATSSRRGNVSRWARSTTTALGWWNAPTRFFPARVIEAGLAADRGVDHRDQRRGDLYEADAAQQACGREPREVTHDAAADGHDERVAVDAGAEGRVPDGPHARQRLQPLTRSQRDTRAFEGQRMQGLLQRLAARALDVRVRDQDDGRGRTPRDGVGQPGRLVVAYVDGVAPLPERHEQRVPIRERHQRVDQRVDVEPFAGQGLMTLGVRIGPHLEQMPRPGHGISSRGEVGTRRHVGNAGHDRLGRRRERRHDRLVEREPPRGRRRDRASAERDDPSLSIAEKSLDERPLTRAKRRFPSSRQSSATLLPAARSISMSVSTNGTPSRPASTGPTRLLPVPMKPLRATDRMGSV